MTPTIGSLFAGIGGFDLGFERAGFKTLWQCEIDKAAQGVLRRHFPDAKLHSDVREVGAHNLEPVDVLTYGSPCQNLSVAGKREGLSGERSGLFYEAVRIIRELREQHGKPDFAIWENVPGAFSSNGGRDFAAVVQTMVDLGARDVCWRVLDSRFFGVAQRRRRVFLVADFGGERAKQILFESESLRGNTEKGRKTRKGAPAGIGAGVEGGGEYVGTLTSAYSKSVGRMEMDAGFLVPTVQPVPMINMQGSKGNAVAQADGPSYTLNAMHGHDVHAVAVAVADVSGTLGSGIGGGWSIDLDRSGAFVPLVTPAAFDLLGSPASEIAKSADIHTPLRARMPGQVENSTTTVAVCATGETTHAITAEGHDASEDGTGRGTPIVAQPTMQVRRLVPQECENLQGFPRNWTAEARLLDGTIKPQADGPRYKQLGNAVTVNVAEWIARRVRAAM